MALIVFEDDALLVVNKPAGWNTHAPAPYAGEGVYDWLKHREPRWAKLAIIHRLDKETSGVLVFGKTPAANRSLTEQFSSRSLEKKYLLLSDGVMKRERFTATSTLVRAGQKHLSRPPHAGGERAETRFTLRERCERSGLIFVEAEPITGRTHQIRVHAAEHGFPILGDTLYGGSPAEHVFLHALEIALQHPRTGAAMRFQAPVDWQADLSSANHYRPRRGAFPETIFNSPRFALREATIDAQLTNAFRLIHGASDGWPGWYVDRLDACLLSHGELAPEPVELEFLHKLAARFHARAVYHKTLRRDIARGPVAGASPMLLFGQAAPERFRILENGLSFELSFEEGYSVGLFLDQRDNRRRFLLNHVAADFPLFEKDPRRREALNAFAYTCGFSVAAAKAGARTTSLDLSKKYLEWGKRNFALNAVDPAGHEFIYGDAFDWMRRLAKSQRSFDAIILDPPTFSHSKQSGAFQADRDYGRLAGAALPLLRPGGVLFCSTNTARFAPEQFVQTIVTAIGKTRRRILQQHYVPQPPDFPITREEPAYLKTVWVRIG